MRNGSSNFTGNETAANLNSANAKAVTIKAKWEAVCTDTIKSFDYTGSTQTFTAGCSGYYKLETWGAQGGYARSASYRGGYGGYSVGLINTQTGTKLYVVVGEKGTDAPSNGFYNGGYNGGGDGSGAGGANVSYDKAAAGGGGATHISIQNCGILSNCSSYIGIYDSGLGTYDGGKVLIIAGGGGGAMGYVGGSWVNSSGHNGGGIRDGSGYTTQTTGHAFGQGFSGRPINVDGYGKPTYGSGGGGGLYGGWRGYGISASCEESTCHTQGGGGGSGYIGNSSLVSGGGITKHMTCYSCTTSTAAATRTNSNTNVSGTATADYSKTGNGYARITYLGTSI